VNDTETIAAKKLSRFGLSADFSTCLVEFEGADGTTARLTFPADQLQEVIGLLLQVKQIHAEKTQGDQSRSVMIAERVGVLVQPDATLLDFMVGGAPLSFAISPDITAQLIEILKQRLPSG
jgi:hypothetical protein